jgi:hypothetical protein
VIHRRIFWRRLLHPLTAILALQATLSLALLWSNTAFTDEAEYLWAGRLEISHWLHGATIPAFPGRFSGSPIIYPPIGAVASIVGGLTAARLLSLVFMLAATAFLYLVAKQLLGYVSACFAAALWALCEPAMRLGAYATYDAMSVFLTALSAWLLVQTTYRHKRVPYVVAAAAALALANATAYSSIVIDPVVIAFALTVWCFQLTRRQAAHCAVWFIGGLATFFGLALTASHSWGGLLTTVVLRGTTSRIGVISTTTAFILKNVWLYAGSSIVLTAIGVIVGLRTAKRDKRVLLVVLGCAILVVPLAQIHAHTETSLDKHLAYGIWFASMVGGYACSQVARATVGIRPIPVLVCGALLLAYPTADNWQAAWAKQHSWANASSLVTKLKPVVARERGTILLSDATYSARYYTPQGQDWRRWSSTLPSAPAGLPQAAQSRYYVARLKRLDLGVIVLFYATTVRELPNNVVLSPRDGIARQQLLELSASDADNVAGAASSLPALTLAVDGDSAYRLVAVGPYDSGSASSTFAIWKRV